MLEAKTFYRVPLPVLRRVPESTQTSCTRLFGRRQGVLSILAGTYGIWAGVMKMERFVLLIRRETASGHSQEGRFFVSA
ncbi:hypothetical protein [Anaeromassilibacillus sp. SJQ-1]|uniref:hypothetical protein n=1 Tax=Anaeromassilibacillus sp. SJQ-1 TaxID=3375419 RepID=UPI003988F1FD